MPCAQKLSPPSACTSAKQVRARCGSAAPNAQRFAAESRGRGATNPLDTVVLAPRSIRLPLLYQRKQVSKGEFANSHGSAALARAMQPAHCLDIEPQGMLDKVELLMSIFDVNNSGFVGFEDLCTLFSVLAETEWSDAQRFNEWCKLLEADPNRGLNLRNLGRLLSLEPTFIDEAFRLLGLEPTIAKVGSAPLALRAELLRAALVGSRSFASRLAMSWKREYACLLASVLSGLVVTQSQNAGRQGGGQAIDEALALLLDSTHELVDATISAVERWHKCFIGYLKSAALDVCVEKWANWDATWGARIAAVLAQVRSVESLRFELKEVDFSSKIEATWRYVSAVGEFLPVLEEAAPQGLILPVVQLSKVKDLAKQILCGGAAELSHPAPKHQCASPKQQCAPTSQSRVKRIGQKQVPKPVQPAARPMGPRHRKSLRAAAYVKRLSQRGSPKSTVDSPSARQEEIDSPCGAKRAATAPAASSRCAQSPFKNSPVECLESKRSENVGNTPNLAQVLLAEIRSTIGRGAGDARREQKVTQAEPPGPEALGGKDEHRVPPGHSLPQFESSQQRASPSSSLDSPILVGDDDELSTVSSRFGESTVSANLGNRTVDLDSSMPASSQSGATYTWRGDPIENASQRSSQSCFIAETISQVESYIDELHKVSTSDASPLSRRTM